MSVKKPYHSGFTLVELMLAISYFSFILLFVTAGFVQIVQTYNKGINTKRVHQAGREIVEEIVREIRVSSSEGGAVDVSGSDQECFNGAKYKVEGPTLYREETTDCSPTITISNAQQLSGDDIKIQHFEITQTLGLYRVVLAASTAGTADVLINDDSQDATCDPSNKGYQYCDVVLLESIVTTRR